ncbi:MAG: FAD-dependent oxidoreductase [Ruminococcaceae bacterium]|nr:FAD-dependent oxidoreductase [Oscillospiraceae bacterium]
MKKYDLIVAGGGLAGVAAAVSASREGLSVLLIEKSGTLGGAISNNLVYPFMRYWTLGEDNKVGNHLSSGIFAEMREREKKYTSEFSLMRFKPEYFKLLLDDMVSEACVDLLFHACLCAVNCEKNKIKSVSVTTDAGILTLEADFFIDTTGDGNLFYLAGCDYQLGRESDGLCQPMTTCFRMSGVDVAQFKKDSATINEKYKELQKSGEIKNPREDILVFYGIGEGIVHFNTTRIVKLDPTDPFDKSRAEIAARRQVYEMELFLKKHSKAFENSTLISIASEIGVRESRKLKGIYVLTVEDLKNLTYFDDAIALGNYDIDIHNPAGSGTSHYYFKGEERYSIPYRSLLPKEYDNLLVAGRCISATHEAQASVRIMPICATLGQAAGTAAALAYKTGECAHTLDTKLLRDTLIKNGAAL